MSICLNCAREHPFNCQEESALVELEGLRGELVDMTDERNVLSARLGQWESVALDHTQHDNCVASDACYEWGFGCGWRSAMTAYRCWCGSPTGPRAPGDTNGVGCLADITHNWCAPAPAGGVA